MSKTFFDDGIFVVLEKVHMWSLANLDGDQIDTVLRRTAQSMQATLGRGLIEQLATMDAPAALVSVDSWRKDPVPDECDITFGASTRVIPVPYQCYDMVIPVHTMHFKAFPVDWVCRYCGYLVDGLKHPWMCSQCWGLRKGRNGS